jgi:LAO/AO transport system kinase
MPHTGDDIQSMKKGLHELAQFVVINKADGELLEAAEIAQHSMLSAFKLLAFNGAALPSIHLCSARSGMGVEKLAGEILAYSAEQLKNGETKKRRTEQLRQWFAQEVAEQLRERFFGEVGNRQQYKKWEEQIISGKIPAGAAARKLLG